jgi:hypothetical protein
MTLQQHRPDGRGGIEQRPVPDTDWQRHLRSPRWGASNRDRRLVQLKNPEMDPTRSWVAVGMWASLALVTFVLLVVGYGTGFWG